MILNIINFAKLNIIWKSLTLNRCIFSWITRIYFERVQWLASLLRMPGILSIFLPMPQRSLVQHSPTCRNQKKTSGDYLPTWVNIGKGFTGSPSQWANIPGCSAVISRRLHFRVLYGINQFQNQFSRIWNRFKPEGYGFFEYFAFKTIFKTGFIYIWNRSIPGSTRKYRWSEMAPEHPRMFRPLRGRPTVVDTRQV